MAFLLKADGSIAEVHPQANRPVFSLKELQGFVGGYIEIVGPTHTGDLMVVNEEGKNIGLPLNANATERWPFGWHDQIVGDVLICTMREIAEEDEL